MLAREDEWACVCDQFGEGGFVFVTRAAVGSPFLNTGWGVSELSIRAHPIHPEACTKSCCREVEVDADVADCGVVATTGDCAVEGGGVVLVHKAPPVANKVGKRCEEGEGAYHFDDVDHAVAVVGGVGA